MVLPSVTLQQLSYQVRKNNNYAGNSRKHIGEEINRAKCLEWFGENSIYFSGSTV